MGTIYRKTVTRPIPEGAVITNGVARWKVNGKSRTAPVTSKGKIQTKASTYTAKIKVNGKWTEYATGCKTEIGARRVLSDLERREELVKVGVMSRGESSAADHLLTPLTVHITAFIQSQKAKGNHPTRVADTEARLKVLAKDCGFESLSDLKREALETWLTAHDKMSAGNRNEYRQALVGFCNWASHPAVGRLQSNPFSGIAKVKGDKRKRRALTEAELTLLLTVARNRPLKEALTIRRGPRKGELAAKIKDHVRERLDRDGMERALIYKTLLLTGLRKNELATLVIAQLDLEEGYLQLKVMDEKNREGNTIPLRSDLVADLKDWVADRPPTEPSSGCQPGSFASSTAT